MKLPVGFTLSLISISINIGPLAESTGPTLNEKVAGIRNKLVSLKRATKYRIQHAVLNVKEKAHGLLARR